MIEAKDMVSFGLGAAGTALGVWNLVRSIRADQVHLRVTPALTWQLGSGRLSLKTFDRLNHAMEQYGPPSLSFSIVNLGKFAVTIDEIGLCEGHPAKSGRSIIHSPSRESGVAWPTPLAPRAAVTLTTDIADGLRYSFSAKTCAFAGTACGHYAMGDTRLIGQAIQAIRSRLS